MTEVDAVISENVSMSAQLQPNSSEDIELNTTNTSNGTLRTTDQLNGGKNKELAVQAEPLQVDAPETDEDDSQITSSTENGIGGDGSKTNENTAKHAPPSSTESSTESLTGTDLTSNKDKQEKVESLSKSNSSSSNEDSSNACDSISQNRDSIDNKSSHDELTTMSIDKKESEKNIPGSIGSSSNKCDDNHIATEKDSHDEVAVASSGDLMSSDANPNNRNNDNEDNLLVEAKDEKSTDVPVNDESISPAGGSLQAADGYKVDKKSLGLENGAASDVEKDDAGIVDLGDDSDEEIEESVSKEPQKVTIDGVDLTNSVVNLSMHKQKSICSDSDGAVVIGSDSENEVDQSPPPIPKPAERKVDSPQEIVDDDDDDCVVIEDDGPIAMHVDVSKRKSLLCDSAATCDDSQPPSKRQRTSIPLTTTNQITIKDARSLMPQEMPGAIDTSDVSSIFPVNIRPATSVQGPPKLVPVSNTSNIPLATLPVINSMTNLLPGLTDDMYVLEAPSFIVPYIYEKPPTDNLREVVRGIEAKYELTKEDLADADKADEFDMMTEQNKEEKEEKGGKKKKRRRGVEEPDESWSEESEEDDEEEDDDSDSGTRTKVLIKEANDDLTALKGAIKPASAVAGITPGPPANANMPNKPGLENYFESPLGKFFMDIGVGQVQEFVQTDLIRLQKRKMRKSLGKNIMEFERAIAALSGNLEASRRKNSAFRFTMKRCEFCNFKSESALSMANHYETPHMNGPLYKCNFCIYEIRNANEIVYHMEAVHNIKARLVKPLPYHQCPNCGFEDNGKAKLARHQPVCAKKFRPEMNLAPPHDWEAPAKIPRIKPRHGLVGTATAYQAMAAQAAAQKAALASIQQQQQQAAQARSLQAAAIAAQNAANKIRGRQPTIATKGPNTGGAVIRSPNLVRSPMATNVVMPNNYQLAGAQLIQNANAMAKKTLSGQPSISITPLPRQSGSAQAPTASSSKMPPAGMKPGQNPSGNKAQFVICEICDGYIKDLEQLRNHMQWMHKVKIHPKMIYNRPPLNCQKCQFRFFTDQGLERHLLGSHGLVTSSMQEAANKGKDAGRCPVCGRLYQWKLLNHVSRDHHMTLKPAHLSYKCTVCTATFGMYKQFETHVYTAHSTVAKKAMDGKKNNAPASSTVSSGNQRSGLSATNDSLLKPLKINDEITIIPQPASKPRITNMESHVID